MTSLQKDGKYNEIHASSWEKDVRQREDDLH